MNELRSTCPAPSMREKRKIKNFETLIFRQGSYRTLFLKFTNYSTLHIKHIQTNLIFLAALFDVTIHYLHFIFSDFISILHCLFYSRSVKQ